MATASECIMFTVLTVMAAETLRESGLPAGFCQTADAARPNQTFEGHKHVCILRGVTRDVDFSIRLTEVTLSPTRVRVTLRLSMTVGDCHSTRCHRPPPDAIHSTMYFMLLHRSVNSR